MARDRKNISRKRKRSQRSQKKPRHGGKSLKQKQRGGRQIEEEDYYHGLLVREDVEAALQSNGDFLVRYTEVKNEKVYVVSVKWNDRVSHFVVKDADSGKIYVDKEQEFDSIGDMVRQCMQKGQPISRKSGVSLINPKQRSNWQLQHEQIELAQKLGEGAFGEVYRGIYTDQDKKKVAVAVKTSHKGGMSKPQIQEMMKETRIMRQFDHPNVVRFYGVAAEHEPILIVMELVTGGGLDKYVKKHAETLTNDRLTKFCGDAARGMQYLHDKKMIHRDVAARNCLITNEETVKISDFGLSHQGSEYKMQAKKRVPIKWLSLETLTSQVYTTKSDVWSYGVLMWEVYSEGAEPYPGMSGQEVQREIRSGYRMSAPEKMPPLVSQIMLQCWSDNQEERPEFADIVNALHPACGTEDTSSTTTNTATKSTTQSSTLSQDSKTTTRPTS